MASLSPSLIDLQDLQLDDARALLEHAGQDGTRDMDEPPLAYLQRVINGLCELSLKDPLTGLGNRRHFITTLERAIEVVARSGESILLLLKGKPVSGMPLQIFLLNIFSFVFNYLG